MSPDERRRSVVPLAVADAVALVVFVLVGIRSHHEIGPLDAFFRNAVPLEGVWFAAAAVSGAYRRPGLRSLLWTWVVAVPVALVVRSLWVGSPTGGRLLVFLGVGLAFTLLFLLAGRAVVVTGRRVRSRHSRERDPVDQ
ncbi:MAG: DUF3054 family protein [Actinomycetota bacterium]